jgi:hypothetical protein
MHTQLMREVRMKRLIPTQHTVRCPLEDRPASVTVRTNPGGCPSRRHRDVTTCSLLPSTPFVPPPRAGYFSDMPDVPVTYVREVDSTPRHPVGVSCSKRCLAVLNAAEPGAGEPRRCTSGVSDALELIRQTQNPAITRLLWFYGG